MDQEKELKAKLGLGPDEDYLCFSRMGGVGEIECKDCGYRQEVVSFVHGDTSCSIGRQCPNCHAFVVENNESEAYHEFGKATEDCVCPECGTVIRKKEEPFLKGNDEPLFCPKCHSVRLIYNLSFLCLILKKVDSERSKKLSRQWNKDNLTAAIQNGSSWKWSSFIMTTEKTAS